jgi:hypothetical protein
MLSVAALPSLPTRQWSNQVCTPVDVALNKNEFAMVSPLTTAHRPHMPYGAVISTLPHGHTYVSTPGSALLFPSLCAPTGDVPVPAPKAGPTASPPNTDRITTRVWPTPHKPDPHRPTTSRPLYGELLAHPGHRQFAIRIPARPLTFRNE